jgi:hypothetical protein
MNDATSRTTYWVLNTGASIAHPLTAVWTVFRDIRSWYSEQLSEYSDALTSNWHRSWSTAFASLGRTPDSGAEFQR